MGITMKKTKWIPGLSHVDRKKLMPILKRMPKGKVKITKGREKYTLYWKL